MCASVKAVESRLMQSEGLWSAPAAGDNADDDALFNGPEVRKLPPDGPLPPPGALQAQIAKVAAMLGVMLLLYQDVKAVFVIVASFGTAICMLGKQERRALALLIAGLFLLSPLMQSLTRTVASDSIIASILGLLTMHLVVHDYGRTDSERPTETLSGSFSLNAAVFASILPASRMQTPLHVFASVFFAICLHLLLPPVAASLMDSKPAAHQLLTWGLILVAGLLLGWVRPQYAAIYSAVQLVAHRLGPQWLAVACRHDPVVGQPWSANVKSPEGNSSKTCQP